MSKYQAAIFDLDGTLIDTLTGIAISANYALEKFSQPTHSVEAYRLKVGDGNIKLMSNSLPPENQHLLEDCLKAQKDHYSTRANENSTAYPGIYQMIKQLQDNGIKLAILSNKPDHFVQPMVNHFFENGTFEIVQGELTNVPLKPDPTSALDIAAQLNAAPEKCTYIGDTAGDIQTANNASMLPIAVTWGFRTLEELQQSGPAKFIDHPSELPPLLL